MNKLLAGPLLTCAMIGVAHATPHILSVYPTYDAGGNPLSLDIRGAGFTCNGCSTVRVRIAGVLLPSSAVTVNSAPLPGPPYLHARKPTHYRSAHPDSVVEHWLIAE
jgi:hypothetical protein